MITTIRYFKEKTHEDFDQYNIQWHENSNRIIYLHIELSMSRQLDFLIYDIENNITKNILGIRFSTKHIFNNEIIKKILCGEGILYNTGVWFPEEIWIYT